MSKKRNRPQERLLKVLEVAIEYTKKESEKETFRVPFDKFSVQHPLLKDRDGLKIAFDKIKGNKDLKETLTVGLDFIVTGKSMTITDPEGVDGYEVVNIHIEDPEALKKYVKKLKRGEYVDSEQKEINSLVLVGSATGRRVKFVINERYQDTQDAEGNVWSVLFDIADKQSVRAKDNKNVKDYFNFNHKCKLYSKTSFEPTTILKEEGGLLVPNVRMEIVDESTWKRRLNTELKSA